MPQISEEIVLDQNTTIPGYAVARPMVTLLQRDWEVVSHVCLDTDSSAQVSASLVMHPRVDCTFTTLEDCLASSEKQVAACTYRA